MREFKFRAWDRDKKRMTGTGIINEFDGDSLKLYLAFHGELMQYTGLKDKNGKEIYEGDIVRALMKSDVFDAVSFEHEKIKHTGAVEWSGPGYFINGINPVAHEWLEVIGNIYENPELLV